MQQAELGLKEALLSNDKRHKFFPLPGSGEGGDILGGKKVSPLVSSPQQWSTFARGMLPAQYEKESAHILIKPHSALRKLKGLHKC